MFSRTGLYVLVAADIIANPLI